MTIQLHSPLSAHTGINLSYAELLGKELGIFTLHDLLTFYPIRYIDRSEIFTAESLHEGMSFVQMAGRISKMEELTNAKGKKRIVARLSDQTGSVELTWFAGLATVKKVVKVGMPYLILGKPSAFGKNISFVHPELELIHSQDQITKKAGFKPIYSGTEKLKKKYIDSNKIESLIKKVLPSLLPLVVDWFSPRFLEPHSLIPLKEAFNAIHFPSTQLELQKAKWRLKFDELFFLQLEILGKAKSKQRILRGFPMAKVGAMFHQFYAEILPFELTGAQKRVIREIREAMKKEVQMNRLVQGDVGSGKTLVALLSMLIVIDNGKQCAFMAPTEILANQHFSSMVEFLADLPVKVRLLTGSKGKKDRRIIGEELASGECHILIGTHALIEDWVQFKSLGLVVVDEQHRFGVAQRAKMWSKSQIVPHVLVMTATPIPRTLAMTLYGDLETSVIDELPPGRKSIETRHFFENSRLKIFDFMRKEIAKGQQVYIVYPLIKESETLDLASLMEGFESIERAFPKPDYQLSIVHGQMKAADKEFEMQRFKKGETQIMVATTVIEVGVDVPNASLMVIENAERFGLSQLHQLRGRVGRGASQSYCFLLSGYKLSKEGRKRLETMVQTSDGFRLAEVDLELRGPGEVSGTQQSGLPHLKIANLATDYQVLAKAREAAQNILADDPQLQKLGNRPLKTELFRTRKTDTDWSLIS